MKRFTVLLLLCLASCTMLKHTPSIDWVHFQNKYDDYPPRGVPALVQDYFRKKQAWPTNKQDIVAFEAQRYGPSNSVNWSLIDDVEIRPAEEGDIVLLWQSRETGLSVTGSMSIGQPSSDTLNIQKYFTTWQTGNRQVRDRITNVDIITKAIWDEDRNTVEALLGPPDKIPPVPEDWRSVGLIWDYVTNDPHFVEDNKVRVFFDTEGRCRGAEGKIY